MDIFEIEDPVSGRVLEIEGDREPTDSELEELFAPYRKQPATEPEAAAPQAELPAKFSMEQYDPNVGNRGAPMQTEFTPDPAFATALVQGAMQLPSAISHGIEAAMQPVEKVASTIANIAGGITMPIRLALGQGMGSFQPPTQPGQSIIPGLTPDEDARGFIPSMRRFGAGLTTPGMIATLPVAAESKLLQGAFGVGAAASIPGSVQALSEAQTGAETRGAATDLALSTLITGLIGRSLAKGKPNAISQQEAATVHGDVLRQPIQGEATVPARKGGQALPQAEAVAPKAPVRKLVGEAPDGTPIYQKVKPEAPAAEAPAKARPERLTPEQWLSMTEQQRLEHARSRRQTPAEAKLTAEESSYIEAERASLDSPIEVVEEGGTGDPFARRGKAAEGDFMTIDRKNGKVIVRRAAFQKWMQSLRESGLPEEQIKQAVKSRLNEETIHLKIDDVMAGEYWSKLTGLEKSINRRRYAKETGDLSESQLGHEALRFRLQQATRMKPSEFAEMAKLERWTWEGLTALEKTVRGVRENFTKLGKEQRVLFDQALENINAAKTALGDVPPASRNREGAEGAPEEQAGQDVAGKLGLKWDGQLRDKWTFTIQEGAAKDAQVGVPAGSAPEFIKQRILNKQAEFMPEPPPGDRLVEMVKPDGTSEVVSFGDKFWPGERPSIARANVKGQWSHGVAPEGALIREMASDAPASRSRGKGGEERGKLTYKEFTETRRKLVAEGDIEAARKLHDDHPDWVKLSLQGTSGWPRSIGPGLGPNARARGGMSKKAEELAEQRRRIVEAQAAERGEALPEELRTKAAPAEEPIPASERLSAVEGGAKPFAAGEIESLASQHLDKPLRRLIRTKGRPTVMAESPTVVKPDFEAFAQEVRRNYGDIKPEQLISIWEDAIWKRLPTATGAELASMRRGLGLEASVGSRPVPDLVEPSKTMKLEDPAELRKIQEEERPRHDRGATGGRGARGYRNTVISAIARKLIGQTVEDIPVKEALKRTSITAEDVGYSGGRTKQGVTVLSETKQPVYNEIAQDQLDTPHALGEVLTADAAVSGMKKSATRRVTLMLDRRTGKAYLVSTFSDPQKIKHHTTGAVIKGSGAVIRDPASPAGHHIPVASIIRRYRPVTSILLDHPVQNFMQRFESLGDFNDRMGADIKHRAQLAGFETPGVTKFEPPVEAPAKRTLTDAEAMSVFEHIEKEVGQFDSPSDMELSIEALKATPNAQVISAYRKMFTTTQRRNPNLSTAQVMEKMSNDFYEAHKSAQSSDQFINTVLARFGGRPARTVQDAPARESATGRELRYERDVAPTTTRPATIPTKPAPEMTPGRPEKPIEPERLSPEDAAEIERQIANMYDPTKPLGFTYEELARPTGKISEYGDIWPYERWLRERERLSPSTYIRSKPAPAPYKFVLEAEQPRLTRAEALKALGFRPGEEPPAARARGHGKDQNWLSTLVTDTIKDPLRAYSSWMTERIRMGGSYNAGKAADIFNKMIDREKELYGGLTETLDPARKAAGASERFNVPVISKLVGGKLEFPDPRLMKGAAWLHKLRKMTPNAATVNMVGALEGEFGLKIPKNAQKIVDLGREANLEIGQMYESVSPGFKATGKVQRNLTGLGYDIIREGPSGRKNSNWDKWMGGMMAANPYMKPMTITNFFLSWKRILDDPKSTPSAIARVNQDFARRFKNIVTHIKVAGQWQPVLHSDLFNYLETSARRASHIRAFREIFPATKDGQRAFEKLDDQVRKELNSTDQVVYDDLLRTLNGLPTDSYSRSGFMAPGRTVAEAFKFMNNTLGNLMAKMVLTGQMLVQPGEVVAGATPVFLGYKNYARGLAKTRSMYIEMEKTGSVNRVMYDWSFDPKSGVRSIFRNAGNVLGRVFGEQLLNEVQEATSAATARVVRERVEAGTLSPWERRMLPETFRAMGFTAKQVEAMISGNKELLGQFERKASAFLTTGNKALAEGSSLGANRLFNSLFRFQSYPMMKMNQLRKVSGRFLEAWHKGTGKEKRAATEQLSRFMFGTAMQGAMLTAITTVFYQGFAGLRIKKNEAMDEPLQFLAETALATIGGPMYLIWRGARGAGVGGFGEQAARTMFPYAMMRELFDMTQGAGPYRDLTIADRIGMFLTRKTPGTRAISTGLATFGLSQDNPELDAAISGFKRWSRDELGTVGYTSDLENDTRKKFRTSMRKAVEAIKDGDKESYQTAISEAALETPDKPWARIAMSLKARKLLTHPNGKALDEDQIGLLTERIGAEAVELLRYHDGMLDALADNEPAIWPDRP